MKKNITAFVMFLCFSQLHGQGIFDATIHTATPFGNVNSPIAESAQQIIDQDPSTKFLDFSNLDGIGFEVDLGMGPAKVATSIAIVTANDAPERDPIAYEIFGSNDGMNYDAVASGAIPCIPDRLISRTFSFVNTNAYLIYRVNFTGNCSPTNINQVADVQLFEQVGSVPTINCPGDLIVILTPGECSGVATFDISATDVEDGMITPTQVLGPPSGSSFPVGDTPVVFSAADSDGNPVSCEFIITVMDTEDPVLECPADMTLTVDAGVMGAEVDFSVGVSDNCSVINPIAEFTSLGTIDGKSYYLSDSLFTPEEALYVHSIENGGVVGTIRNESDNAYILNAVARFAGSSTNVLIGYNDVISEGNFAWFSGDPSTYNNWNEGEPNNSGVGGAPENFTIMLSSGFWNDVASLETITYRYLLEVDFEVQQTSGLESGSTFPLGATTNAFTATDLAGNIVNCEFTITIDNSVSTEDQLLANKLTVSPNPAEQEVFIRNESNLPLKTLTIYDIYGKQIHSIDLSLSRGNQTMDISALSSGIYLLKIQGEKGTTTKKIIKK